MAAKKTSKRIKKTASTETKKEAHWFPEEAKAPTAATAPVKKTSPWQRRAAPVNYGTLAKPGLDFKQIMMAHIEEKYPKLSEAQRKSLWSVVATQMLTEPSSRLIEIVDREAKAI